MVAEGSRQVEAAVDAAVGGDPTSGLLDPLHFRLIFRLVIGRHLDGLAVAADDAARVAGVGDEQLGAADEGHDGGAAGVVAGLKNNDSFVKRIKTLKYGGSKSEPASDQRKSHNFYENGTK